MNISFSFHYASRSLVRGGQYTLLAVFCVAVGVMAVVALQLVGFMLQNALTTNAREINGGDISVTALGLPLKASDLAFFGQMKSAGTITGYTALIDANGGPSASASSAESFLIEAVDPRTFPLVDQPAFVQPEKSTVASLLGNDQVIVTQNFLATYQKQVGDSFTMYVKGTTGSGFRLQVKIVGVVASASLFA